MKRVGVVVLLALAAVTASACRKQRGKPQSVSAAACEAAIEHAAAVHGAVVPSDPKLAGYAKQVNAAANAVLATRCKADHWPKAALDCLTAAKDDDALDACMDQLTAQQSMAVQAGIQQAAETLGPAPDPTPTPTVIAQETAADAILHITQLKEAMCACPDATCAESVNQRWADEQQRSEAVREVASVAEQWERIDDAYVTCQQKWPVVPNGNQAQP